MLLQYRAFPAISVVARRFFPLPSPRYFAGLWQFSMLWQLNLGALEARGIWRLEILDWRYIEHLRGHGHQLMADCPMRLVPARTIMESTFISATLWAVRPLRNRQVSPSERYWLDL